MIADLKPYAAYRRAEGGWLGEVPSHWTIRRMKYVVREVDSRSTAGKEQLLRVSQYTGVTQRRRADGLEEPDTRADSLVGYKRVQLNDLVINIMLAWNGSMGVSRYDGIASPAYCVYRFAPELHPWYFHNLLRSPAYKAQIKASSTGVVESRLRLYSDDLGRIEAMLPPPDEQEAIVRFLDWANRRLERAIRAKRKVIALLGEQKQAIIHRAVTRGLDPSVPLKPSGIPWLGDIPQHWEVHQLRRLVRPGRRITYGIVQPGEPDPNGRFMIRGQDYSAGWARAEAIFRVSPAIETPYSSRSYSVLLSPEGSQRGNWIVIGSSQGRISPRNPDWMLPQNNRSGSFEASLVGVGSRHIFSVLHAATRHHSRFRCQRAAQTSRRSRSRAACDTESCSLWSRDQSFQASGSALRKALKGSSARSSRTSYAHAAEE